MKPKSLFSARVIEARSAEIAQLEAEIDHQVYGLFGLAADEVDVMAKS